MMKRMRGRNLAHPGCLIGITVGMVLGIIVAGVMAMLDIPLSADLVVWLGMTVLLAIIGWITGSALSSRFPALEETPSHAEQNPS